MVVAYSKGTRRRSLTKPEPTRNKDLKQNIAYSITVSCNKVYIRENGRYLKTRTLEYRKH